MLCIDQFGLISVTDFVARRFQTALVVGYRTIWCLMSGWFWYITVGTALIRLSHFNSGVLFFRLFMDVHGCCQQWLDRS
jgi:hypothetical protein